MGGCPAHLTGIFHVYVSAFPDTETLFDPWGGLDDSFRPRARLSGRVSMQEFKVPEKAAGVADRTFYEAETQYFDDPEFFRFHLPLLEAYMSSYRSRLAEFAQARRKLKTLELGAGTCMTSLLLSREPWIAS